MFRGCPFGLKPISSTFQRTMNILFHDLAQVLTLVDDIIIFSHTLEEHTQHVAQAIDRLTSVNLNLNSDKCHFAQQSVYLLGFCVSAHGIGLDPRKVCNVQEWAVPATGKDVQRFLGVINYFCESIPNAASRMAPLDKLRHAHRLNNLWTKTEQAAFNDLKHVLLHAPILSYPDLKHPFHLATDASNTGIGDVLYQIIDNTTHHIAFMARSLSPSERNYSTTKCELLAIIFALNKFHPYLWAITLHYAQITKHWSIVTHRKLQMP